MESKERWEICFSGGYLDTIIYVQNVKNMDFAL